MNRLLISVTLFLCVIFNASATELKGQPEELRRFLHPVENIVTLTGEGKETAYSDKAIVNLIITTEEDGLADSLKKNSDLRSVVVKTLIEKGINQNNIKTSKFSTSPQFGWFGDSPNSYKIINRMSVNIINEKQLQEIAKISDANKEIELANTNYVHTKKDEFLLKVKKKALNDAMKQKAFYESSLGVKLITRNFRNSNSGYTATRGAQELAQNVVITGSRMNKGRSFSSQYNDASIPLPQSFDEVEYKATIFVDFVVVNIQ